MSYKVGSKGQVVIDQDIRRALGVEAGWVAAQRLVDDHVQIRFYPPEHDRSLLGVLGKAIKRTVSQDQWPEARERAWKEAAEEREGRPVRPTRSAKARSRKRR